MYPWCCMVVGEGRVKGMETDDDMTPALIGQVAELPRAA